MQIIITGGAGFLSQRLTKVLLNYPLGFEVLLVVDLMVPPDLIITRFIIYCQLPA